ncbi:MAG: sigma-70 family RNA polymerase sigma factor [Planctomycetes bacterium]|nr:sigma-70 family RNA polymerase sigma factor [Planctomycetota bacterium]
MEPDDDELVSRCLETKEAASTAFNLLYARHSDAVLGFLLCLHRRDEHAARDAHQETFFRFYRALGSFQRGRPLRPWLFRIARNVSLDHWKKKSTHESPQAPETLGALAGASAACPVDEAAREETRGLLRAAVERLPQEELTVFALKHDQGLTYAEVADVLACSVRTAKYRMKSALGRIGREAERLGVNA